MKKISIILSILFLLVVSAGFASAQRYITYNFMDGEVIYGGWLQGTNSVSGVNALGYVCADTGCNAVSSLWGGAVQSTNTNSMTVTYPTTQLGSHGYGLIFYKPGYITWEQSGIFISGTSSNDPLFSNTVYLTKARMCRAQVDEFSVINDAQPNIPVVINVSASLDSTTHAALAHAGPVGYVPPALKNQYYSLETYVELNIYDENDNIVYTSNREVLIEFSGEARTHFTWTPTVPGDYVAVVSSYVTDDKCLDSEWMNALKAFSVLEETPNGACYTLLNNLTAVPIFAEQGTVVTINARKLSNVAYNNGTLAPLPSTLTLNIYRGLTLVHSETRNVPANSGNSNYQDITFSWVADRTDMLSIVVSAIAQNCPFTENLPETETINYYVYEVMCHNNGECGEDTFTGPRYCSAGNVYQNRLTNICNVPGTEDSYCSIANQSVLVQTCTHGCQNGACIIPQTCNQNSDCGNVTTQNTCSGNDVIRNTVTPTCFLPGSANSYCQNIQNSVVVQHCVEGCFNGECIDEHTCDTNSDCGTDGFTGAGVCQVNDLFRNYITYTCNNAGTPQSSCSSHTDLRLVQHCPDQCVNGACVIQHCNQSSDCGVNGPWGSPFCQSNDLYSYFRSYTCVNPGTPQLYCTNYQSTNLLIECLYGCANSMCKGNPGGELDESYFILSQNLYIQDINFGDKEYSTEDNQLDFGITLANYGPVDFEDLAITVSIYDLGVYHGFGNFVIHSDDMVTKRAMIDLYDNIKPGTYDVRIEISSDDVHRIIYREVRFN